MHLHIGKNISVIAFENIHEDVEVRELLKTDTPFPLDQIEFRQTLLKLGILPTDLDLVIATIRECFEDNQILPSSFSFSTLAKLVDELNKYPHEYLIKSLIANQLKNLAITSDLAVCIVFSSHIPPPFLDAIKRLMTDGAYLYYLQSHATAQNIRAQLELKADAPVFKATRPIYVCNDHFSTLCYIYEFVRNNENEVIIASDDRAFNFQAQIFLESLGFSVQRSIKFSETKAYAALCAIALFRSLPSPVNCYNLLSFILDSQELGKIDKDHFRNCFHNISLKSLPSNIRSLLALKPIEIYGAMNLGHMDIVSPFIDEDIEVIRALLPERTIASKPGRIKFMSIKDAVFMHSTPILAINPANDIENFSRQLADIQSLCSNPKTSFVMNYQEDIIALLKPYFSDFLKYDHTPFLDYEYIPFPKPLIHLQSHHLPKQLSASAIEKLINNPYVFYANYVLGLRPLDDYGEGIQKEFGILIHDSLAKAFENKNFTESFLANFNQKLSGIKVSDFIKLQWTSKASKIIAWLHENIDFTSIKHLEAYGETIIEGIVISSRADMIEQLNNQIRIVDFKTGTAPTKSSVERGLKPQLAIESIIASKGGFSNCIIEDSKIIGQYIEIKGRHDEGKFIDINIDLARALNGLNKLLAMFYTSQPLIFATIADDFHSQNYSLLLRTNEWS